MNGMNAGAKPPRRGSAWQDWAAHGTVLHACTSPAVNSRAEWISLPCLMLQRIHTALLSHAPWGARESDLCRVARGTGTLRQ